MHFCLKSFSCTMHLHHAPCILSCTMHLHHASSPAQLCALCHHRKSYLASWRYLQTPPHLDASPGAVSQLCPLSLTHAQSRILIYVSPFQNPEHIRAHCCGCLCPSAKRRGRRCVEQSPTREDNPPPQINNSNNNK